MPEATALKCWLCGRVGGDVKMAVKTGDFVGPYHLIPRCADTEACWRRLTEQTRAPAQGMTFKGLREAIDEIRPK